MSVAMSRGHTVLSLTVVVFVMISSFGCMLSSASAEDEDYTYDSDFTSFYDQLSDNAKVIYDKIGAVTAADLTVDITLTYPIYADSEKGLEYVESLVKKEVSSAFFALKMEAPLALCTWGESYIEWDYTTSAVGDLTCVSGMALTVVMDENYADDPETDNNELQEKVDALNDAIEAYDVGTTDLRTMIGNINSYLTSRLSYDSNYKNDDRDPYAHDAYGALVSDSKLVVCDGFSRGFQVLCQKYDITCYTIIGYTTPELEGHAWNAVMMDNDKWYPVDVTWNQGSSNKYLLCSAETVNTDHVAGYYPSSGGAYFDYPVYSETKYDADPWYESQYLEYAIMAALGGAIILGLYLAVREDKKKGLPKK